MKSILKAVTSSIGVALCAACAGGGGEGSWRDPAIASTSEQWRVEQPETASSEEVRATSGRTNGEVAIDALKGAGKGARVCAAPLGVGALAGPLAAAFGGYLTVVCMPFGVAAGALIGATGATNNSPQAQVETAP